MVSGAAFLYVGEIAGLHTPGGGLGVSRLALSLVLTSFGRYITVEQTLGLTDTALCGAAMRPYARQPREADGAGTTTEGG